MAPQLTRSPTKFCSVAPLSILKELRLRGELGRRHLLLAHDVVQYTIDYHAIFGDRASYMTMSMHDHIIMDNSAFELKAPVDSDMVWEAIRIARPTCAVLPDVWLDAAATLEGVKDVLEGWSLRRLGLNHNLDFMVIPQGNTLEEWVRCAEELARLPLIEWWGVPRNFRDHLGITRAVAVRLLHRLNPQRKIHLFGFSHDYVDDAITCSMDEVYSIDSTTPLRAGSLDMDFYLTLMDLPARGDWWETAKWNDKILTNLNYCRSIF